MKKKEKLKKVMGVLTIAAIHLSLAALPVFADTTTQSGADLVTTKIGILYNIIAAFISSYGGIQVLWGVFEWGNATNTQDGMMQSMSIKRIGGGLIEVVASQLVAALIA